MTNLVSNLIASPARILYGTLTASLPADTVAPGAAWPAGWTDAGFTSAPLTVKRETEEITFEIEQSEIPVKRQISGMTFEAETTLAEIDLALLAVVWGGTVSTTAQGVGQPGKDELSGGGTVNLTARQWGFEGSYVDASGNVLPIRLFIYNATAVAGGELQFSKGDAMGIPLQIKANADMTRTAGERVYKVQRILSPALP